MQPVLEMLRQQVGAIRADRGHFSTGTVLDNLLPNQCFRRGSLVEWVGGSSLALRVARAALRDAGVVVVVDSQHRFYPPAAARGGLDLSRLVIARPRSADHDWLVHQALACEAVDAVLCWPTRLTTSMARRWQLAAESGGGVALVVRDSSARGQPSWAELQLTVTGNRLLRVEVTRGRTRGCFTQVEIDDEGNIHDRVRLAHQLAPAATGS